MAKTTTKAAAAKKKPARSSTKTQRLASPAGSRAGAGKGGSSSGRTGGGAKREPGMSAADALMGLLESPLVADILAAGAAAALAAFAQRGLSRRQDRSSKTVIKNAAKAAATAMGARIAEEIDEILAKSKETKRAAK
jgi:hypothetical protein